MKVSQLIAELQEIHAKSWDDMDVYIRTGCDFDQAEYIEIETLEDLDTDEERNILTIS